jgi:hypothetical protein
MMTKITHGRFFIYVCYHFPSVNEGDLVIQGNRTVNYLSLDIEGAELQVSWIKFSRKKLYNCF